MYFYFIILQDEILLLQWSSLVCFHWSTVMSLTQLLCYKQVTETCSWVPVFCPYNKTCSINTTNYNHLCLKWVSTICHKHIRIVSLQVIISLSGRKLLSKVLFPGISNKFSIHLYLVGCDREISQCVINNCIGLSLTS